MTPKERLGDRRAEVRFEIIGELWATLVARQSLPVVNIGFGGMLVESAGPLMVGSEQRLRLIIAEEPNDVSAAVRHVTPAPGKPDCYLIGLAFTDVNPRTRERIEALIAERDLLSGNVGEA